MGAHLITTNFPNSLQEKGRLRRCVGHPRPQEIKQSKASLKQTLPPNSCIIPHAP